MDKPTELATDKLVQDCMRIAGVWETVTWHRDAVCLLDVQ